MALTLTTERIALVHTSDPEVSAPEGPASWVPADAVAHSERSTVVMVRPLSGLEFARLTTIPDLADQLAMMLPLCVVAVDGIAPGDVAGSWPWQLVQDMHTAIVTISTGGELPLGGPQPEALPARS